MTAQSERYDHIDSIRGAAALSVTIFHALLWYPSSLTAGVGQFLDFGKFGVVLFFMISGFVVPFSLESAGSLRAFLLRRAFRLYPAYWLSLAAAVITGLMLGARFRCSKLQSTPRCCRLSLAFQMYCPCIGPC